MSNLAIFNFKENQVRTAVHENGEIYFCLSDVADVLEIDRTSNLLQVAKGVVNDNNPRKRGVLDPKGVVKIYIGTEGGNQKVNFINEPNLYRVIFRSNKKQAIEFQNWVFEEVLPTIRKTGSYTSTIDQSSKAHLSEIVRMRTGGNRGQIAHLWQKHNTHFNIASYHDLPESKLKEAESFLWSVQLKQPEELNKQVFSQCRIEIGEYLGKMRAEIIKQGGNLPPSPNFDNEAICNAYMKDILLNNRFLLTFEPNGEPKTKLIPTQSWIVTKENIAKVVADPSGLSKETLLEIMKGIMTRLESI